MRIFWWTNECVPCGVGLLSSDPVPPDDCWRMGEMGELSLGSVKELRTAATDDRMGRCLGVPFRRNEVMRRGKVVAIRHQLRHKDYDTTWRVEFILDRLLEDLVQ